MKQKITRLFTFLTVIWFSLVANQLFAQCSIITTIAGNGTVGHTGDGGAATAAQLYYPFDVKLDVAGNLYIADEHTNCIRKINTSGVITTFAGTTTAGYAGDGGYASSAQLTTPAAVAVDASGNIYIADMGNYCIRKVNTSGIISTYAGTGTSGYTGDGGQATAANIATCNALAMDASGNLALTDASNDVIRVISPSGIISTVAGSGTAGFTGAGGPATAARIGSPTGVAWDASGNLYISDFTNNVVYKVNTSGTISIYSGTGTGGYSGDGGPATAAQLYEPYKIRIDAVGNLFIADDYNDVIRKVTTAGVITTVAGTGGFVGFAGDGGSATAARLSGPLSLDIDNLGNIYIDDYQNERIRKVTGSIPLVASIVGPTSIAIGATPTLTDTTTGGTWTTSNAAVASVNTSGLVTGVAAGSATISYSVTNSCGTTIVTLAMTVGGGASICNVITKFAGNGSSGSSGDGGAATSATMASPYGVAMDAAGNLYIADQANNRIRKVSTTGVMTTVAGTGTYGFSGDGGAATAANMTNPLGIAVDAAGNIYFSDYQNDRIRKVTAAGIISTIAGPGSGTYSGDGGAATAAGITLPAGVAVDAAGNVFFADESCNRIRKISTSGIMSTVAGNGTGTYSGDGGQATAASLTYPRDVAFDAAGNMYIADAGNATVRKVTTSGIISTVAGSGVSAFGGDGGAATAAYLHNPVGVAIDGTGNIYISDYSNYRIRKVNTSGIISTFTGSGSFGYSGDGGAATAGVISYPLGITTDAAGNIYFADEYNNVVRKITSGAPEVGAITGAATVTAGASTTLSDTTAGGTWTTSSASIASVNSSGVVTGVAAGSATISYSVTNSCGTSVVTLAMTVSATSSCNIITTFAGASALGYSGDGGPATAALLHTPNGVGYDASGNVYIVDYGNHVIRKVTPSGIISTIAGTGTAGYSGDGGAATAAMLRSPTCVAVDAGGNIYIGDYGNYCIRKIAPSGIISTYAGTAGSSGYTGDGGPATSATFSIISDLVLDGAGNLYIADESNNCVRKITASGTISTVAGTGTAGHSGDGGPATAALLRTPTGIAVDGSGNLFVVENTNHCVRKVNSSGTISTYAGVAFSGGFSGDGGPATAAQLNQPNSIAVDGLGNLYIADYNNNRVRIVNSSGTISTFAGTGTAGFSGDGGPASAATFVLPDVVKVDGSGNIYITDVTENRIRIIRSGAPAIGAITGSATLTIGSTTTLSDTTSGGTWTTSNASIASVNTSGVVTGVAAGSATITYSVSNSCGTSMATLTMTVSSASSGCNIITTIAGNGTNGYTGDGGAATAAEVGYQTGVAIDASGNVYIADGNNSRIRKVTPAGIISTIAGNGTYGYSGDGGAATAAELEVPFGVAVDASGNVYVVDNANNRIRKITAAGIISTIAGNGTAGYSGDGGPATAAEFQYPTGIAVDGSGNVYVADYNNQRVRKITPAGIISTIAGNGTGGYTGDGGAATAAELGYPTNIAIDGGGNVYIVDEGNGCIRKVTPAGIISTIAGDGTFGFSGDGGAATAAKLHSPYGVAVAGNGNVYIADFGNNRIRQVTPAGIISSIAGNGTAGYSGDGGVGTAAELNNPYGVAVDGSGNVYIADYHNNRVRKVTTGNPAIGAITGTATVTVGSTTTLSDTTLGGTWTTSSVSIASVNTAGVVTGVAAGSATISYSVTNSCGTSVATLAMTVSSASSGCNIITTIAGTGTPGNTGDGGAATSAQISFPMRAVVDAAGNVYIPEPNQHYIRKISPSGIISTVTGTGTAAYTGDGGTATAAGVNAPYSVVLDAAGNIFFADVNSNCIRKINTSGIISTYSGNGTAGHTGDGGAASAALLNGPSDLAIDATGNMYVVELGAHCIRKITTAGIISTIAGTAGTSGFSGDGGAATAAKFNVPIGIALDGANNIYIADKSNNRIRKINNSGIISTIAGTATAGFSGDGGAATAANLNLPWAVATDRLGNIYVADYNNLRIRQINTSGIISTFAGYGGSVLYDGGPATAAGFAGPTGISIDATGNLYIADNGSNRVRKITSGNPNVGAITGSTTVAAGSTTTLSDTTAGGTWTTSSASIASVNTSGVVTGVAAGSATISYVVTNTCGTSMATLAMTVTGSSSPCVNIITTVAGDGTHSSGGDGGPATSANIYSPEDVIFDASGNMYIADYSMGRIRKVSATTGIITTFAGNGSTGHTGDGGQATAAQIGNPSAMAFDAAGNLYFTDAYNGMIRKVTAAGFISTVAGIGTSGFSGDGGAATSAKLNLPFSLKFDPSGNLIVADRNNHCIRKINGSGIISTIAGAGGTSGGSGDGGAATAARLYFPSAIAFDSHGNMYIADYYNNKIRKINTSNVISTYAGTGTNGTSGDGGAATACTLNYPGGLAVDANDNVYVSDFSSEVRVINNAGIINLFAGSGSSLGDGGAAQVAMLSYPNGMNFDVSGNLYIADYGNYRVRKVTSGAPVLSAISGTTTVSVGSTTTLSDTATGGSWVSSNTLVATVSGGVVYGVSEGLTVISYMKSNSCSTSVVTTNVIVTGTLCIGTITTIAGTGTASYSGDGGPATAATFDGPGGPAMDASGNIYVSDYSNQRVRKITPAGIISTVAGTGTSGYNGDGIAATTANLAYPCDVQVDASGNLYILENIGYRIRKVSASGVISTIAGTGTAGYTGDGGPATAATIEWTSFMTVDNSGNVYFSDYNHYVVRKITASTGIITTIAGNGTSGHSGDGGFATAATLGNAHGLAVDVFGNLYIADGSYIRKVTPSGIISTFAGGGASSAEGVSATAASMGPYGLRFDPRGNLYYTDQYRNSVRRISAAGIVNTVSGNGTTGFSGDGGSATSAQMYGPVGLLIDINENIYVTDGSNDRLRKVTAGGSVATIAGATSVNVGSTISLTDGTSGGSWSSSATSIATVNTTGTVYGAAVGTAIITYSVTTSCGSAFDTALVTVNAPTCSGTPSAGTISSTDTIGCSSYSSTISLTGASSGAGITYQWQSFSGSWTNIVGATSSSYTTTVSATIQVRCVVTCTASSLSSTSATSTEHFNSVPVVGAITGSSSICIGTSSTFTDTTAGGTWTSSSSTIASVNAATGSVFGVAAGSAIISYSKTNACGTTVMTYSTTVNSSASAGTISGASNVCVGASTTLTSTVSGGSWTSGSPSIASVGSGSGSVTGVATGSATITYTVSGSCGTSTTTYTITVNPLPNAGSISGAASVCQGATTTLTDGISGGSWSSSDNTIASVNSTGIVSGIAGGSATISYTVANSCGSVSATSAITVNPLLSAGAISGTSAVCPGTTSSFTDAVTGGVWSTSNASIASVNTSGLVTGVAIGSATISYAVTNSCGTTYATQVVTVNSSPSAGTISGATSVCGGATTTLSDAVSGGAWSSSNSSIATVSTTGVVTGVASGSVIISYTVSSSCGSATDTALLTVISGASAGTISGVTTFCQGSTNTLTDAVTGGTWTSSNVAIASVSATGTVYGLTSGTATISYTVTTACGTAVTTKNQTVNPLPVVSSITGTSTACVGYASTLADATSGGTWSSSNTSVASVNSSGVVTGVAAGSATITYTVTNSCGSTRVTASFTVTTAVSAGTISGASTVCAGTTTTLTDAVTGGTWTSSNAAVASVNSSGTVTGIAVGTATITYTIITSCGTAFATASITVNPAPYAGSITGTTTICPGPTTTLTDAAAGGTWSSSNIAVATVDATGNVTGVATAGGTDTITYTVTNSCGTAAAIAALTVIPSPSSAIISGTTTICTGTTTTLTASLTGGTWSSSNPSIASINSSGLVRGIATGTATITYTITNACGTANNTTLVTINTTPSAGIISGASTVCQGASITLTDAASGGTWRSSNTTIATVSTTGVVTGINVGTVTVSYVVTTACGVGIATASVTVNAVPSAGTISGPATVCAGSAITLTESATGGVWSSSNPAIASIDPSTGIVMGVTAGSATISYAVTNSCGTRHATTSISVGTPPSAGVITGTTTMCTGGSVTLADAVTGGTWSSSNISIATVDASGGVSGITAGSATISYTITGSCGATSATTTVTVNTGVTAAAIVGSSIVCAGGIVTLTDATAGGTWGSSDATIATISAAGVLTGVAPGTVTITYTVAGTCGSSFVTASLTVNGPPSTAGAITGLSVLCPGSTAALSDTVIGGAWSSNNTAIATINSAGIVTGRAIGSAIISYTVSNSCGTSSATFAVAVTAGVTAGTISGASVVCTGVTTSLSDSVSGGAWTSSNNTIAAVGSTGVVSGVAAGTAVISYTVTNSCGTAIATHSITVNPSAVAGTITGTTALCVGSSSSLADAASGGTWSSSNPSVASVNTTGFVTAVSVGTAMISYAVTNSCGTTSATATITVSSGVVAGTITGAGTVCTGASITLTDGVAGGLWYSSNPAIATIDVSGNVTGVAAGTATISYTVTNGCGTASTTATMVVNTSPGAGTITGASTLCAGGSTTLADAASGGAWSSSNVSVASVSASGSVTGLSAGTATISYTVTGACGSVSATLAITVTAGASAGSISGPSTVCAGSTITLTDATTGGTWSSSNPAIASINTTGIVTGTSVGTTVISYTVTGSCGSTSTTATVNVSAAPSAGTITGTTSLCIGTTTTLSDAVAGGIWSTSNAAIASIGTTGIVHGISAGSATISYSVTNACGTTAATATVSVTTGASAGTITGTTTLCAGATTTLSDAVSGGTWSSSNAAIATVNATGVVGGVSGGTVTISYVITSSCGTGVATATVTVNPLPSAGAITGAASVCIGAAITLSDAVTGGSWSSSSPSIATVGSSGIVTGVSAGSAVISYTVTNSCGSTSAMLTIASGTGGPTGHITPAGPVTLCGGSPVDLSVISASGGLTYRWYKNGVLISGATSVSYHATSAGTYDAVIANGCGVDTLIAVTVLAQPNPAITLAGAHTLSTGSFSSYQWFLNGAAIAGATSSVYVFTAAGVYTVRVTNSTGCAVTSAPYTVSGSSTNGIIEINNAPAVAIYPNPSNSIVHISADVKVNVVVTNATGRAVIEQHDASDIDLSIFADGMYMILVYDENNVLLKAEKLIKVE